MERGRWLAIGVVRRPHGVRGKICVTPLAEYPRVFLALEEILLGEAPERARPYRVVRVQLAKGSVLLELEGVTLDGAVQAVDSLLWVRREQLPPLEQDEYYWQDLLGMEVVSIQGQTLGHVEGLIETGDSQVLVCRGGDRELLIPFVYGIIQEVDQEGGRVLVDLPQGLE